MNLLRTILIGGIGFTALGVNAVETSRWHIAPDNQIIWSVNENIPHEDHIEMSGKAFLWFSVMELTVRELFA